MGKIHSLAIAAFGAAGIYAGIYHYENRFSKEAIWARQKPKIENISRGERVPNADARFAALRTALDSSAMTRGTSEARCRFETEFEATTQARGNATQATTIMQRASYDPYNHCTKRERMFEAAGQGYSVAGTLAFAVGIVTLISSVIDSISSWRKERKEAKKAPATDPVA